MLNYVKVQGQVVGLEVLLPDRIECFDLPTQYIGHDDDVVITVLRTLAHRRLRENADYVFGSCDPLRDVTAEERAEEERADREDDWI